MPTVWRNFAHNSSGVDGIMAMFFTLTPSPPVPRLTLLVQPFVKWPHTPWEFATVYRSSQVYDFHKALELQPQTNLNLSNNRRILCLCWRYQCYIIRVLKTLKKTFKYKEKIIIMKNKEDVVPAVCFPVPTYHASHENNSHHDFRLQ